MFRYLASIALVYSVVLTLHSVDGSLDLFKSVTNKTTNAEFENLCAGFNTTTTEDEYEEKANLIQFKLYNTATTNRTFDLITYNDSDSLASSRFIEGYECVFLIHGFGASSASSYPQDEKDYYIANAAKFEKNVLIVNWTSLAGNNNGNLANASLVVESYFFALINTEVAGRRLAEFIKFLVDNDACELKDVHVVGWSLGAHVSGWAGHYVQQTMNGAKLPHITGLDPALPGAQTGTCGRHVNYKDAFFVDFIHSDIGQCGTPQNVAHAVFYLNNGCASQPGCPKEYSNATLLLGNLPSIILGSCSHSGAPKAYAFSIKDTSVKAAKCTTVLVSSKLTCNRLTSTAMYPWGENVDTSKNSTVGVNLYRINLNSNQVAYSGNYPT